MSEDFDLNIYTYPLRPKPHTKQTPRPNSKLLHPTEMPQISLESIKAFFTFSKYNSIQEQTAPTLLTTSRNVIVSAPTASGKTTLFEFALIRYFGLNYEFSDRAAVYISPIKALCQEKLEDWKNRFSGHWKGINIQELTSDSSFYYKDQRNPDSRLSDDIAETGLIVSTPEKFNLLLRKWKEHRKFFNNLGLVLIDEIHTIDDEDRGVILESLITRLKLMQNMSEFNNKELMNLRVVCLSATLNNINDFGTWLNASVFVFNDEYRPVKLDKVVLGYLPKGNPFLFDLSLNYRLYDVINKYSCRKPCLVFVSTKKATVKTCQELLNLCQPREFVESEAHLQRLTKYATMVSDQDLKLFLLNAIGFHNAGLDAQDRSLLEQIYRNGDIKVLATTSTLALGVNLPAYMVVIKGTKNYKGNGLGYVEYTVSEILQMAGRAGRPQYEDKGIVVVMTERSNVDMYENYLTNNYKGRIVESKFLNLLVDNLNNEIALRTVKSFEDAVKFFKSSFAYVRFNKDQISDINQFVNKHIESALKSLSDLKLIERSFKSPVELLDCTSLGAELARQNVSHKTIEFIANRSIASLETLIELLSEAVEFEKFPSKMNERKFLKELNNMNRYRIKKSAISSYGKKAFVLIQTVLNRSQIPNWELKKQAEDMQIISIRILSCFKKYYVDNKSFWGLHYTLVLTKYMRRKMWLNCEGWFVKQMDGFKPKVVSLLGSMNICGVEDIKRLTDADFADISKKIGDTEKMKYKNVFNCITEYKVDVFDLSKFDHDKNKLSVQKTARKLNSDITDDKSDAHERTADKNYETATKIDNMTNKDLFEYLLNYSNEKTDRNQNRTYPDSYELEISIEIISRCDHKYHTKTWIIIAENNNIENRLIFNCLYNQLKKSVVIKCKNPNLVKISVINDYYMGCDIFADNCALILKQKEIPIDRKVVNKYENGVTVKKGHKVVTNRFIAKDDNNALDRKDEETEKRVGAPQFGFKAEVSSFAKILERKRQMFIKNRE